MPRFATYLYPHTCYTSKPVEQIAFTGFSYPHFSRIRQALASALEHYPALPIRQAAYQDFARVHTPDYLAKLEQMAAGQPPAELPKLGIGCQGLEHCLPGYRYGLGGMLEAIDQMQRGDLDRAYCFCLGGHHAYADWGHGYCLLNAQAAAARYAQTQGFARILIVDWDIHHGDGTQAIFAHDPSVYHLSLYSLADLYMSLACGMRVGTTAVAAELGHCNIPILHQAYPDNFCEQLGLPGTFYRGPEALPAFQAALRQLPWQPDLIFIHSGYDGHKDDCGGNIMDWTNETFEHLTRAVLAVAQTAACPVISVHGGGYNPPVTLAAALRHVEVLASAG